MHSLNETFSNLQSNLTQSVQNLVLPFKLKYYSKVSHVIKHLLNHSFLIEFQIAPILDFEFHLSLASTGGLSIEVIPSNKFTSTIFPYQSKSTTLDSSLALIFLFSDP